MSNEDIAIELLRLHALLRVAQDEPLKEQLRHRIDLLVAQSKAPKVDPRPSDAIERRSRPRAERLLR